MAAAKTIDIIGRSTSSSDDAVRQALDEARRTVRNITAVDVVSKGLRGEDLTEWRALVRVAFVVDRDEPSTESARRSAAAEAAALRLAERAARGPALRPPAPRGPGVGSRSARPERPPYDAGCVSRMIENTAPCGSLSTAKRPTGVSVG